MEVTDIWRYLPHRYPFLLVDRVLEFEENQRIVTLKNITIVEALAQSAGILAFRSRERTLDDGYIYYLAGTDKTKFKRSVIPGDQLRLEVEIINLRTHWMKAQGKAFVDDALVCSSILTCAEQKVS